MPKKSIIKRKRNRNPKKKTKKGGSRLSSSRSSSRSSSSSRSRSGSKSQINNSSSSRSSNKNQITLKLTYDNNGEIIEEKKYFDTYDDARNYYSEIIDTELDDVKYHINNSSDNVKEKLWTQMLGKNKSDYKVEKLEKELKNYYKQQIPTVEVKKGGKKHEGLKLELDNIRETKITETIEPIFRTG